MTPTLMMHSLYSKPTPNNNEQSDHFPRETNNLMPHDPIPMLIMEHRLLIHLQSLAPHVRNQIIQHHPIQASQSDEAETNGASNPPWDRVLPCSRVGRNPRGHKWVEVRDGENGSGADTGERADLRLAGPMRPSLIQSPQQQSEADAETEEGVDGEGVQVHKELVCLIRRLVERS
jgi:hypothetical protein